MFKEAFSEQLWKQNILKAEEKNLLQLFPFPLKVRIKIRPSQFGEKIPQLRGEKLSQLFN